MRGKPFSGQSLPWAEPFQHEMITRIVDVARTVAAYRIPAGPQHDLIAACQAVSTGLAIIHVQQVNRALDCSLEMETTQLINELLNNSGTAVRKAL
ncbi:hypothetical protein ABT072_44165 [Streptomyces sp. NPDC002589]|uniref:hypothetical protein n=1 Tax=Streptomyces sp. NPDC002589 TaxID=3154420 RepID=UPI0033218FD1